MGITIKEAGFLTTVQDQGREEYQHLGVPVAGAVDTFALRVGNLLLGNNPHSAGLECTLVGPTIIFNSPTVFALTGAEMEAQLNGYDIAMWTTWVACAGDVLRLGIALTGLRTYITVAGGIDTPLVLGSRAAYLPLHLGAKTGRLLAGDALPLGTFAGPQHFNRSIIAHPLVREYQRPTLDGVVKVRITPGPQHHYFSAASHADLTKAVFSVDNNSDRMGIRFQGAKIAPLNDESLISDGIPLGAMQISRDGTPIVMMADRQPTGGYPKIAVVTAVDVPLLAQCRPGTHVKFQWISREDALDLFYQKERELAQLKAWVQGQVAPLRAYRITVATKLFQVSIQEK